MAKDEVQRDVSEAKKPPSSPFVPAVVVNRGLLGIPDALAFWRRKKPASS